MELKIIILSEVKMIIQKNRIISVKKYLEFLGEVEQFYVCVKNDPDNLELLRKKFVCSEVEVGSKFIPENIGVVTSYNANGKRIVRKDLPKEPRTFEHDFHVIDWHGQDHYGTCFQTRDCYPVEWILPPCEYLIADNEVIRSELISKDNPERVKHIVNLFLEIFGMCETVDAAYQSIISKPIKRVEWTILPPGKYPWDKAKERLISYFDNVSDRKKITIQRRHKVLADYVPDFVAIGKESFKGYIVYGYTSRGLYYFESNEPDNATYVFKGNWEEASKLTKRDILKGDLCYKRFIHSESWEKNISQLMK